MKGGWDSIVSITTQSVQGLDPSGVEILLTFPEQPEAYPASGSLSTGSVSESTAARAWQCQVVKG